MYYQFGMTWQFHAFRKVPIKWQSGAKLGIEKAHRLWERVSKQKIIFQFDHPEMII